MARVTVEDCVDKVPNRFELVLLAAHRARSIANGAHITIEPDNDKNPVISLREIADKTIPPDDLREGLIHSIQKNVEVDEPESGRRPVAAAGPPPDARPRRPVERHAGRCDHRRAAAARHGKPDADGAVGQRRRSRLGPLTSRARALACARAGLDLTRECECPRQCGQRGVS